MTEVLNNDVYITLFPTGEKVKLYSGKQVRKMKRRVKKVKKVEIMEKKKKIKGKVLIRSIEDLTKRREKEFSEIKEKCDETYAVPFTTQTEINRMSTYDMINYFYLMLKSAEELKRDDLCESVVDIKTFEKRLERMIKSIVKIANKSKKKKRDVAKFLPVVRKLYPSKIDQIIFEIIKNYLL